MFARALLVVAFGGCVACRDRAPIADSAPTAPSTIPSAIPSATSSAVVAAAPDSAACKTTLDEIHALRSGAQPCMRPDECTVWVSGEYWNGCPVEVNVGNARKLDALRITYETTSCPVETNAACAPRRIVGCKNGTCGGT
jgi:hypothetical protein